MKSSDIILGIVSPDAPPLMGGMGRHVGSLVEGFTKEGIRVHVFDRTRCPCAFRLAKNIGFSLSLRFWLPQFIKENGITILQIHSGTGGVLLPYFPQREAKIVVTANHTYAAQSRLSGQRWKKIFIRYEKKTYERADRIIAISQDTAESLLYDYGISEECITVIGCGFDLTPWMKADSEKRDKNSCVFVGRPDTRKGWDIVQAAWPLVLQSVPSAILNVVGFTERPREGMHFFGRLSDADLQSLIGKARLSVCPSRLEGFGLAAAESIASGTPVAGTNVAGLRRVIRDGETGILSGTDPVSVARSIVNIFHNDALWKRLHEGCRTHRQEFGLTQEIHAHLKLFSALYS